MFSLDKHILYYIGNCLPGQAGFGAQSCSWIVIIDPFRQRQNTSADCACDRSSQILSKFAQGPELQYNINWLCDAHILGSFSGLFSISTHLGYLSGKEITVSTLVLVGYATRYGSTQEVAEAVTATLRECGLKVDIQPVREVRTLAGYSAVVLGAPLFMFRWHKDALRFLSRHREALTERPVAVFALGPVHDPYDEKEWQDSCAQLDKALAKFPWLTPVALEMFGGKYDPAWLRFPINLLAGKEPASDIRDWTAIRAWASNLAAKLEPALP